MSHTAPGMPSEPVFVCALIKPHPLVPGLVPSRVTRSQLTLNPLRLVVGSRSALQRIQVNEPLTFSQWHTKQHRVPTSFSDPQGDITRPPVCLARHPK